MPYSLIPLLASIILGAVHVTATGASTLSKLVVSLLIGASLFVWWAYPQWLIVATLIQVAVSIYVIVYLRIHGYAI